jgi:hypothetical protein
MKRAKLGESDTAASEARRILRRVDPMRAHVDSFRGGARLGLDWLSGLIDVVEGMHETIARRPLPWERRPPKRRRAPGAVAPLVYQGLRGALRGMGIAVDAPLAALARAAADSSAGDPSHDAGAEREAQIMLVGMLNGVCGDHLERSRNPLAVPMHFRTATQRIEPTPESLARALPDASPHVVLLVHGLCLSERSFLRRGPPAIGARLETELGCTSLYLRYNSGRHISTNGRELAAAIERMLAAWPVPVESLVLVGHSMGGLLLRSAMHYGARTNHRWLRALRCATYVGTPHHGATLEQLGHVFGEVLDASPYLSPLAIGRLRSAGIQDLRHGSLLDEDWATSHTGRGRDASDKTGPCAVVSLPSGVDHCFVAGSVGHHAADVRGHLLGDLLVRTGSALGEHRDPARRLARSHDRAGLFYTRDHFDLLDDEEVGTQLVDWLRQ